VSRATPEMSCLLERCFRVSVILLSYRHGVTVQQLSRELGVSTRQAYRYLVAAEHAGIPLEKVDNRFKLYDPET
jgi:predicted DNA-binding transcriptional regulator YafY